MLQGTLFSDVAVVSRRPRRLRTTRRRVRICEVCRSYYRPTYGDQRTCGRICGVWLKDGHPPQSVLKWRQCRCGAWWSHGQEHCPRPKPDPYPACVIPWSACRWCGRWYVRRQGRKYCSKQCAQWCHPSRTLVTPIAYEHCRACERLFITRPSRRAKCCSQVCARRLQKMQDGRKSSRFSVQFIGARDNWRCHICKRKVRKDKGNTNAHGSVDHLVPRSMGGSDTLENVALAHRLCNSIRCTGGEVQLRLIG